ncbi:MAG: nuclear transport factor 2 family protein [Acidobacteria bacterium]|nr:nuclear transport factor 2 family protein [Acidobacteriota bacterium]MBP7476158.1 nuclear transport factor 2 family protein [Pyrinomonadaceae bacterium]MBP9108272.1 nuclear transport factor 2 family protein [Pyrinomonadaceae bacterium]
MTNGEIIKGLYEAFATGNVPAVLGAFDENISWTEAEGFMYAGTYDGPNGVLGGVFMKLATEWKSFSVKAEKIVDGNDGNVVVIGTEGGKYLKTGKTSVVPCVHEWVLSDGKVTFFRQHLDTLVMARELGL